MTHEQLEKLLARLEAHIAHMAEHQKDREQGRLLIEAYTALNENWGECYLCYAEYDPSANTKPEPYFKEEFARRCIPPNLSASSRKKP